MLLSHFSAKYYLQDIILILWSQIYDSILHIKTVKYIHSKIIFKMLYLLVCKQETSLTSLYLSRKHCVCGLPHTPQVCKI